MTGDDSNGTVYLIKWTGDDQNRFESRVVDLKATERFNFLNGRDQSGLEMIRIALRAG